MKIFIVFLVIFLSFSDGRDPIPNDNNTTTTTTSTGTTTTTSSASTASTATSSTASSTTSESTTTISTSTTTPVSPTADVTVNVTWTFDSQTKVTSVVMIVRNLKSAQWAAIGLGQEQQMDQAHVFMCKRLSNDTIVLHRYINPGDYEHSDPVPAGSEQGGILTLGQQTFTDGVVTCQFTLSNFTAAKSQLRDLNPLSPSRSYHPLFAIGSLSDVDQPNQHDDGSYTALSNLVQLNQDQTILYRISLSNTTISPFTTTTISPFTTTTTASPTADVSVNVTWTFSIGTNVTSVVMIIKNLKSAQWAAIGLGQSQKMGEAHVFMCKRLSNDTIVLNRYINPKNNDAPKSAGSDQGGVLTFGQQTYINDVVTCQFTLSNFTAAKSQLKDLNPLSQSGNYHPLFAIGLLYDNGEPKKHSDDSRTALSNLVQLNKYETILYRASNPDNGGTIDYYQIHGMIMVFAWIFFASTGILISRYFKISWSNNKICGEAAWFAAHRFILSIATILTIVGFLFVLVASQGTWVKSTDEKTHFIHSITGAIVISFAFFQPFIALFRCKPDSSYRFIYNYLHGFIGFSALILSIVTLFCATYFPLFKDDRARILVITWTLWIVLIFIVFEIIQIYSRTKKGGQSRYSNINASNKTIDEIVDSSTTPSVTTTLDSNEHESTSEDKLKNVLLALHILFAAILAIIFSICIV